MADPTFPPGWLPQAAVPVTVVWVHPEYDDTIERISVARDWEQRGEDYIRQIVGLDEATRIIAVFPGHHVARLGGAVNS
jgi:hypothetical protein